MTHLHSVEVALAASLQGLDGSRLTFLRGGPNVLFGTSETAAVAKTMGWLEGDHVSDKGHD
jgi:hypothetical protein